MANAGAMQSAALRRLAAAMRQDEEQVLLAQQAAREEERERTLGRATWEAPCDPGPGNIVQVCVHMGNTFAALGQCHAPASRRIASDVISSSLSSPGTI